VRRREQSLRERILRGEVDHWNELYDQDDVYLETVEAVPALLEVLERGRDDRADLLYFLSAAAVGQPERVAAEVRSAVAAGAPAYRRLLGDDSGDVRAGAVAAIAAAGGAADEREVLERLAAQDPASEVREHAALALGLVAGTEEALAPLLGDAAVSHALVEAEPPRAAVIAEVALDVAAGSEDRRRDGAPRLAEADAPWRRALGLEGALSRNRLPTNRDELARWAAG